MLTRRLAAVEPLPDACLAELARIPVQMRHYDAGQYMLREGDRPRTCRLMLDGFTFRHKIFGDGGRQIMAIHMRGDFIDVQQLLLNEADHNVQALTAATICVFQVDDLVDCARRHAPLAVAMWHLSLIESSITREWVANIGRRDARARTAHLLCELAIRCDVAGVGARESLELPMTQEQLGDTLGLTSVHVNRTLKTLEQEGVISRSKRAVSVANWLGLQMVGDFSSQYLHLDNLRAAERV